jgi:hypothetical protein
VLKELVLAAFAGFFGAMALVNVISDHRPAERPQCGLLGIDGRPVCVYAAADDAVRPAIGSYLG